MPGTPAQEAAVREVVADAGKYRSDPERFLPLHAPDVEIVNFGGRRVAGREALGEAMRAALASPLADVAHHRGDHRGRFPREGVAVVAAVKRVHGAREEPDGDGPALPAASGQLTYLLVEEGGRRLAYLARADRRDHVLTACRAPGEGCRWRPAVLFCMVKEQSDPVRTP
ncbi:SgcJ/EcaC family oxidoreductase [Streptomyces sp. CS227]|uniref:SgcJ/EcaC family oxidoreductase n=1 Tax=Streptomyces sp. CS227 TaxID=1982763 RepID=UPI00211B27D1|nr:SgcJ/EcaC family oxidoreductase [Streptomyces sp. CS227]